MKGRLSVLIVFVAFTAACVGGKPLPLPPSTSVCQRQYLKDLPPIKESCARLYLEDLERRCREGGNGESEDCQSYIQYATEVCGSVLEELTTSSCDLYYQWTISGWPQELVKEPIETEPSIEEPVSTAPTPTQTATKTKTPLPTATRTPTSTATSTSTLTPSPTVTLTLTPTASDTPTPTDEVETEYTVEFITTYVSGDFVLRNVFYYLDGGAQQLLGTITDQGDFTFTASFSQSIRVHVNINPGTVYYEELYIDGYLVASGNVGDEGLTWTVP